MSYAQDMDLRFAIIELVLIKSWKTIMFLWFLAPSSSTKKSVVERVCYENVSTNPTAPDEHVAPQGRIIQVNVHFSPSICSVNCCMSWNRFMDSCFHRVQYSGVFVFFNSYFGPVDKQKHCKEKRTTLLLLYLWVYVVSIHFMPIY